MIRILTCGLAVAAALGGCKGNELGPDATCLDCPPAVEPGGRLAFDLNWFEEPCEDDSRALGPLLRFCTEVDIDRELECSGPCEVTEDHVVIPTAPADPFTVTARLTRRDDGEVHEETFDFRAVAPDRLELVCTDDCRFHSRSAGDGYYDLRLRAFAGDDRLSLNLESVSSDAELGGWNDHGDEYDTYVDATEGAQTIVVTHSSGLTASVEVPGLP